MHIKRNGIFATLIIPFGHIGEMDIVDQSTGITTNVIFIVWEKEGVALSVGDIYLGVGGIGGDMYVEV